MAFYLFPGITYKQVLQTGWFYNAYAESGREYRQQSLRDLIEFYYLFTKQYWGMGFFLQFIPGTNANLARQQLSTELESKITVLKSLIAEQSMWSLSSNKNSYYGFEKYVHLARLNSNITPIYSLISDIGRGFQMATAGRNRKMFFIDIFMTFPIVSSIFWSYYDNYEKTRRFGPRSLQNILRGNLNPIQTIISSLLNFLHLLINRLIEVGAPDSEPSSFPRQALKTIVNIVFGLIKIPVKILSHAINFTLDAIDFLVISPIVHILSGIIEAYKNNNKTILIATVEDIKAAKELSHETKIKYFGKNNIQSTCSTHTHAREYFGIARHELSSSLVSENRLIAVRGPQDKIATTASLLNIVTMFKKHGKIAKNEPEAIDQAFVELSAFR